MSIRQDILPVSNLPHYDPARAKISQSASETGMRTGMWFRKTIFLWSSRWIGPAATFPTQWGLPIEKTAVVRGIALLIAVAACVSCSGKTDSDPDARQREMEESLLERAAKVGPYIGRLSRVTPGTRYEEVMRKTGLNQLRMSSGGGTLQTWSYDFELENNLVLITWWKAQEYGEEVQLVLYSVSLHDMKEGTQVNIPLADGASK